MGMKVSKFQYIAVYFQMYSINESSRESPLCLEALVTTIGHVVTFGHEAPLARLDLAKRPKGYKVPQASPLSPQSQHHLKTPSNPSAQLHLLKQNLLA